MQDNIVKPCELVQNAVDTFIFVNFKKLEDAIEFFKKYRKLSSSTFHPPSSIFIIQKTEFSVFAGIQGTFQQEKKDQIFDYSSSVKTFEGE